MLSLHDKAEVVQYHDILTDTTLGFLRNGRNSKHSASGVGLGTVRKGEKYVTSTDRRLSTVSWLPLSSSTETMGIAKLVKRVTGFEVLGHDQSVLQIAAYGPGGHYDPHTDSVSALLQQLKLITLRCTKWKLNRYQGGYDEHLNFARIGTLMFYVSPFT